MHVKGALFLMVVSLQHVTHATHTHTCAQACRDGENQEKFQMVVDLAQQCLPQDASELTAFASELEREWKNARDLALAEQILASQLRSSTLDC